ncbi:MAG: hypothetical protein ACOYOU_15225 [Kiritimatiellia bacterium]
MSSTYLSLHYHLVFGTKNREPMIEPAWRARLHEEIGTRSFAWQEGYAAFTVSATARETVRQYIANQEKHHRVKPFREELIEMLNKAGIAYDAKYLD